MPHQQRTGRALHRHRSRVAAFPNYRFPADWAAAPLVAARHERGGAVLAIEVRQNVGEVADERLWRQRRRQWRVGVQGERADVGALHKAAHAGKHHAVAAEIRRHGEQHRVHQRFLEHPILEQERLHEVADGGIPIVTRERGETALPARVGGAAFQVWPHAIAPFAHVQHRFQHALRQAVGAGDFRRNRRVAMRVQVRHVGFKAQVLDLFPCAGEFGVAGTVFVGHPRCPSKTASAIEPQLLQPG